MESWGARANKVIVGANDVPIDARGAPLARAADAGPLSALSTDLPPAMLLGAQTENDPVPFWLDGGRKIPNVSDFKVPSYAHFANRVRRHTGLALIGSFSTGADSLNRGFAITTNLRLVPTSKLKPDTGSPFHGVELTSEFTLPIAFVRSECDKDKPCAHTYRLTGEGAHQDERTMPFRHVVRLSGKTKRAGISLYRETVDGAWLKASDLGVATAPSDWPSSAQAGAKWIDISIENQVMVLWEGQNRCTPRWFRRTRRPRKFQDHQVDRHGQFSHQEQTRDGDDGLQRALGGRGRRNGNRCRDQRRERRSLRSHQNDGRRHQGEGGSQRVH